MRLPKKRANTRLMVVMSNSKEVQWIKVAEAQVGQRLDNFLLRRMKGVPKSRIYRLIRRGEVRVNKKRCKPERKLEMSDQVRIPPYSGIDSPQVAKPGLAMQEFLLASILFEDEQLLVINKPAGLAVHGGSGIRLGAIEALRQCKPEWGELELAHRLDLATSGCLVISKKSIFLKHIQKELKARNVKKNYLALVHGSWPENLKEIDAPLMKEAVSERERVVKVNEAGKPSLTRFFVKERYSAATLLEVMPETGRTHQIRVHCQHAGHSIVGDPKYTSRVRGGELSQVKNLCLHAWKIQFSLPESTALVKVEAPLDNHLNSLLSKIGNSE
ncbi:MAG: 23S rRNA pseudouridine(955/2504/2580) synthase [SAR86 cluster bacterium]|uniref:Pseudouridine synthase n=1 Tax=SAR86 cluster bacterium TaxID=2030880 RepID=A0A2A5B3K5_9GAMM|nr:MAG: 23S rRNA pseudouridine(955/2504/2580) synthase [SAR86 cluster bacterium]